ncbi:MAG: CPXCG motif-containing cysteine-rich protein [Nannocystaceae bacterium]
MPVDDEVDVQCPYCGEWQSLDLDPQTVGEMIQDCDICCRPWSVRVYREFGAPPRVVVTRA